MRLDLEILESRLSGPSPDPLGVVLAARLAPSDGAPTSLPVLDLLKTAGREGVSSSVTVAGPLVGLVLEGDAASVGAVVDVLRAPEALDQLACLTVLDAPEPALRTALTRRELDLYRRTDTTALTELLVDIDFGEAPTWREVVERWQRPEAVERVQARRRRALGAARAEGAEVG